MDRGVCTDEGRSSPLWQVLYLLSGSCSLCYQLIWVRQLQYVVGSTIAALSIVTALFMGGLALGSYLGGRLSSRTRRGYLAYTAVEACTTVLAAAACIAIPASGPLYAGLTLHAGRGVATVLVPLVAIAPATTAMGMSMPVLAQAITGRSSIPGVRASRLYVVNTSGALAGAVGVGFFLIRALGVTRTWMVAVGVNAAIALAGAAAVYLGRLTVGQADREAGAATREAGEAHRLPKVTGRCTDLREEARAAAAQGIQPEFTRPALLFAFVVSGFLSFGYEVYWARSLSTIMGNSTYAIATVLATTLGGLVIGSWVASARLPRMRRPVRALGLIELGIGISAVLTLPLLVNTLYRDGVQTFFFTGTRWWLGQTALRFGVAAATLLVPSILNGATLPLMIKVMTRRNETTGRDLGSTYAADAAGNTLGTLVPAFVMVPMLGITRGLVVLAALNIALGLFYLSPRRFRWTAAPAAALLAGVGLVVPITYQFPSDTRRPEDVALYYREGAESITAVYQRQDTGDIHMSVDGVFIGGTGDSARKEYVLAHLHAAFEVDARRALTIGLGSGVLAAELAMHEQIERIDVIELAPTVVEGASKVLQWQQAVEWDERLRVVLNDVMSELMTTTTRYDLIISDGKSRPTSRGNGVFLSTDYYRALASRLERGGIVLQWVALNVAPIEFRTVLRTFAGVYPYAALFWLPDNDAFLIGSNAPLRVRDHVATERLHTLHGYGVYDGRGVHALIVADRESMLRMAGNGPMNTLDRPVVEFYRVRDYARPASELVSANLAMLGGGGRGGAAVDPGRGDTGVTDDASERGAARVLARVLADAYGGRLNSEELDRRALSLAGSDGPLDWALSNYLATRAAGAVRRGEFEVAVEYAAAAVDIHPNPRAYFQAATALSFMGRLADARTALELAAAYAPSNTGYRNALARVYLSLGDVEEARRQYEQVLHLMPGNVVALQSLGVLAAAAGDAERAETLLRAAYAIGPAVPDVIDSLAWLLHATGRTEEARSIIRRAGAYAQGRPDLLERRAEIQRSR